MCRIGETRPTHAAWLLLRDYDVHIKLADVEATDEKACLE